MNLDKIPISSLTGIGPKYEFLLNKLEIFTIEDLIYHFPYRYEDFSNVTSIKDLKQDETQTIKAQVLDIKNVYTRNRKKLTNATVMDETGQLKITWFNQHYITNIVKKGEEYYFRGKMGEFSKKPALIAPQVERADVDLNEIGMLPVYSETKGLSSKWLRKKITEVLEMDSSIFDFTELIPNKVLKNQNLIDYKNALNKIHFPKNHNDVKVSRDRFAFQELFLELLRVIERREEWNTKYEGIELEYEKYKDKLMEFEKSLPFELTKTQKEAINGIINDLKLKHPMNRLLEGDVGSGKTVVAIVASYLCHLSGYKTIYLAPTEILATQHYETYKKFLKDHKVDIKLQTGSNKSDIVKDKDDIVVGTHAVLYEEELHNVGLIIIDEQHRFGVEQRAKILQMGTKNKKPNLLSMTATPIPRTLALTLYGDLDISVLDAVPNKDKKITTKVTPEKYRQKAFEWIKNKGEQAFIVCPFIEQSEAVALENIKAAETEYKKLKEGVFKDISVGLLHGKMKPKEKQQVMEDFKNKKYQVLVSTPVIEVGVDIPEATIIVIESAERYGLASLHQLRGRVGRGSKQGYCLLFMTAYSKTSFARLKNLEHESSGMKLAEIDLKYRGQGDIFGVQQHGFKNFRVASLNDLALIERAKKEAVDIYSNIKKYPNLNDYLQQRGQLIERN